MTDVERITAEEAASFFRPRAKGNAKLIENAMDQILSARCIFDIGANSGFFSKTLLEAGYRNQIVLFEPVPNLMSIAVRTLARFNNEKIFVNAALGEASGEIDIFLPENGNIGWITAVAEKANHQKPVKVALAATVPFVKRYEPDFIKIDVEGFESFILRPVQTLIGSGYRPSFLVEIGWGNKNPHWSGFLRIAERFDQLDYDFFAPDGAVLAQSDICGIDSTCDVLIKPRT
mgnify:CR=1 FL=1